MRRNPINCKECQLVGEEDHKEVFYELNNEVTKLFLEVVKTENKIHYISKKRGLKSLGFRILKTSGIAFLKDSIGMTSGIFPQLLSIPYYMMTSIKNSVRILKGIDITTKNMTEKNFSVLTEQIAEERKYNQHILEYMDDLSMQLQFNESMITYQDKHTQIKTELKQTKQKMKSLSKDYIKK